MKRRYLLTGLLWASGVLVGVGAVGAAREQPARPCLANYTITRERGPLPAGVLSPRPLFASITPCGVARQYPGEPQACVVGGLRSAALRRYMPRRIVESLLYAGDIETMLHLHATFCLSEEMDSAEQYRANFHGSHAYCTNECTTAPLAFTVTIDKRTRTVTVQY
ncbi:MAG: hypothetical protein HY696_09400 [Deltaproteobacteria bacterium]|nr:hypothetical protein [Deltaproteobacteria bacterium]